MIPSFKEWKAAHPKKVITDYEIIVCAYRRVGIEKQGASLGEKEFDSKINEKLCQGYDLYGDTLCNNDRIFQAVVKYEIDD